MTRLLLPVALLAISLSGCTLENAGTAATSMKEGLTQVGEKVQSISSSEELKNATESAKDGLATTGEIAVSGTELAKEALTSVGETTVKVGEVAGATLTTIGNTVIEAKANLTIPPTAPEQEAPPVQTPPAAAVVSTPPAHTSAQPSN